MKVAKEYQFFESESDITLQKLNSVNRGRTLPSDFGYSHVPNTKQVFDNQYS